MHFLKLLYSEELLQFCESLWTKTKYYNEFQNSESNRELLLMILENNASSGLSD